MPKYLSVSDLSFQIKEGLEALFPYTLYVTGEVSNFKIYRSGHAYFSLKDSQSVLSAVMWASAVEKMKMLGKSMPQDGDQVIVAGRLTLYPPRGNYQLSVISIEKSGVGLALLQLEELKKKLANEGIFDPAKKRNIPQFPRSVGVVAGLHSAGLKDIETNLRNRWPIAKIYVFPSLVQGNDAPKDIIRAITEAENSPIDVLIVGRGGGSSEDLGAFNDEMVVRKVAACRVPVISAVGHEVDITLTDFAADKRVSTPTAAAVAAVPNKDEIRLRLDDFQRNLTALYASCIQRKAGEVDSLSHKPCFTNLKSVYENKRSQIELLKQSVYNGYGRKIMLWKAETASAFDRINAMDPKKVLERGYTMTLDSSGNILKNKKEVHSGDEIKTMLADGELVSIVK